MTQHITQEQATQIAAQFAEDALYETNICNAAIQHYLDQHKAELPVLPDHPEPRTMKWSALEIEAIQAYGQQRAAQARKLALGEAEKRMLTKAAELGIYNHHATKALVEALRGK